MTLVYTCVTCKRDQLPSQDVIPGVEFVCFTDSESASGWDIKQLYETKDCGRLTARWHKLHPHIHSPDHDYWIWVDGHLNVKDSILQLLDDLGDRDIAAFAHRRFTDPYGELEIFEKRTEHHQMTIEAIELARTRLKQDEYPIGGGMHESTILIMRRCQLIVDFLEDWWANIVEFKVPRDQLHFSRLLRKHGLKVYVPTGDVKENDYFIWHHHHHPATDETQKMLEEWTITKS